MYSCDVKAAQRDQQHSSHQNQDERQHVHPLAGVAQLRVDWQGVVGHQGDDFDVVVVHFVQPVNLGQIVTKQVDRIKERWILRTYCRSNKG